MNCFPVVEGDRTYVRRVPGVSAIVDTAKTGIRGMLDVEGVLYVVWSGSVTTVTGGTTVATLTGSIPGTDGVTIARNNRVTGGEKTPDIVAVREGGGAYVLTSSAVTAYADADLPSDTNSVAFLGGFFLFSVPDGRVFASELNSTTIEALSFATAESRADGLKRIIVQGKLAYAMGDSTIEPYQNVGTMPFPLQLAASVIPVGLLTTMAAVGDEEAWNRSLFFVASDKTVRSLSGYEAPVVSTADVERFIAASTVSTIEMAAFIWDGKPYVAISSDAGTWVLNVVSGGWHERISIDPALDDEDEPYGRWRASRSAYSGGRWIFGDKLSGKLLTLSNTLLEDGTELGGFIQSGQMKAFPFGVKAKLQAEFTKAALPIFVSWSHDGGETWGDEVERSLADAIKFPVDISNMGTSTPAGIIVKFRWSGAGDFSFSGATADRIGGTTS